MHLHAIGRTLLAALLPLAACSGDAPEVAEGRLAVSGTSLSAQLTRYVLASEDLLSGQRTGMSSMACPPSLGACYHREFLCSGYGVAMQGTGMASDGKLVRYISGGTWESGYTWLTDCEGTNFAYSDAVRGAAGRELGEGHSIAVDPGVIALGSYVWIDSESSWFRADDTGGAIDGNHIDVYMGASNRNLEASSSSAYVVDDSIFRAIDAPPPGEQATCAPVSSSVFLSEGSPCFDASGGHTLWRGQFGGYDDSYVWTDGGSSAVGIFRFEAGVSGAFTLEMNIPDDPKRVAQLPVRVSVGGAEVSESISTANGGLTEIGAYDVSAGQLVEVEIGASGAGSGRVVVDNLAITVDGSSLDDAGEGGGPAPDLGGDDTGNATTGAPDLIGGCGAAGGSGGLGAALALLALALWRRRREVPLAVLFALGTLGCEAAVQEGLPCGPRGECPEGQVCGTDLVCSYSATSCSGSSCDDPGDGSDGPSPTPTVDTHGAVGTIRFTRGGDEKCVGTLIASNAFITTASCVAGGSSYRFHSAGSEIAVTSMISHPESTGGQEDANDIAIGFLESPLGVTAAQLSSGPPERGSVLDAVVPMTESAGDMSRYQVEVKVEQVETQRYRFSSPAMAQPFACPTAGGPTFAKGTAVLVGLQSRSPCTIGMSFVDIRVDVFREWIEATLQAQSPASCEGVDPEPCAGCGMTVCDDSSGSVEITCVANNAMNPCTGGYTCDTSDASCDPPEDELECQHNGGTNFRDCGDCGWEFCLADGTWSGECGGPRNGECLDTEECVQGPAGGGYSSTWICEPAQPVTCSVPSEASATCPSYDSPPLSPAVGVGWATSHPDCTGIADCKWCTCIDDDDGDDQGIVQCSDSCFPHNI